MATLARKSGPIPDFARNQTDLGAYLMPPRDRKIIQRAMKREGNPGRTPDGRYPIAAWQVFITAHFGSVDNNPAPDKLKLQNEKLVLEIETLRFKLQVQQREFSANTDIELWVGDMVMKAKHVLLKLPSALTPKTLTMSGVSAVPTRIYDGTTTAGLSGTAILLPTESGGAGNTSDGMPYSVDRVAVYSTLAAATFADRNVANI